MIVTIAEFTASNGKAREVRLSHVSHRATNWSLLLHVPYQCYCTSKQHLWWRVVLLLVVRAALLCRGFGCYPWWRLAHGASVVVANGLAIYSSRSWRCRRNIRSVAFSMVFYAPWLSFRIWLVCQGSCGVPDWGRLSQEVRDPLSTFQRRFRFCNVGSTWCCLLLFLSVVCSCFCCLDVPNILYGCRSPDR